MPRQANKDINKIVEEFEKWSDSVDQSDLREVPIEDLRAITSLVATEREVESAIAKAVERAREDGYSWSQIGTALGVSKQAAQQKYGVGI